MPKSTSINWENYRNEYGALNLEAAYRNICTKAGNPVTVEGLTYIAAIERLQSIVSRQLAAVIIVTATLLGCD